MSTGPSVVLTREAEDNEALARTLRGRGIPVISIPCLATRYQSPEQVNPAQVPACFHAVTFSSRRGVRGLQKAGLLQTLLGMPSKPIVGVVGNATGTELRRLGFEPDLVASPPEGRVLAGMLLKKLQPGQVVLTVRGNLRAGGMDGILSKAGMKIVSLEVYENQDPLVESMRPFDVSVVFVASPSAGRRLLQANPWMKSCRFVVIGKTTRDELERLGARNIMKAGAGMDAWVQALCQEHQEAVKRSGMVKDDEMLDV